MRPQRVDDRAGVVHRADPFTVALVDGSLARIAGAFTAIVDRSFASHSMRAADDGPRSPERMRRLEVLKKWFCVLQGDLGWTTDRALSELYRALAVELDGGKYEPPKNRIFWSPDAGLVDAGLLGVDDPADCDPSGAPSDLASVCAGVVL